MRRAHALTAALAALDRDGLRRSRRTITRDPAADRERQAVRVRVSGRDVVNFCSNDYLGLAHDPRVAAEMARAAIAYGSGAGASHLVSGHGIAHAQLEEALATYSGRERALLFSTGYMANLGVIGALAGRHSLICEDRLNHASLIDAARATAARVRRYAHGSAADARRALDGRTDGTALLVTDGVFSMDGDVAPLRELAQLAREHDAWLVVDDAHGFGVLGETGRGSVEAAGLSSTDAPVLVGTLGKAFGTFGAFVAGDVALIDFLLQRARTYIYTTALPPAVAAASLASLRIVAAEGWRRDRVLALTRRFRAAALNAGLPLTNSLSPIQPVLIGRSEAAVRASDALLARGFWVSAIRPPTVPRGGSRLRVTLSAAHTELEVDELVAALTECVARA